MTVAVDPKVLPLGSEIYIPGLGTRTAQDTGGAIKNKRIDVYFGSHKEAQDFGRKTVDVYVKTE